MRDHVPVRLEGGPADGLTCPAVPSWDGTPSDLLLVTVLDGHATVFDPETVDGSVLAAGRAAGWLRYAVGHHRGDTPRRSPDGHLVYVAIDDAVDDSSPEPDTDHDR